MGSPDAADELVPNLIMPSKVMDWEWNRNGNRNGVKVLSDFLIMCYGNEPLLMGLLERTITCGGPKWGGDMEGICM